MKNGLFLSRFSHFIVKDDIFVAYHSLRMMPVYFPIFILDVIEKIKAGVSLGELAECQTDVEKRKEIFQAIEILKNAKVLIEDLQEDEKVISYFRDMTGEPYPHLVYFILTDKCNFCCKYCFLKNNSQLGYVESHMSKEVAIRGLDLFCRLIGEDIELFEEEKTVVFYGGEPLMNWRVLEFLLKRIEEYQIVGRLPKKTILNLVTNGTLLTPYMADVLKKHNVQVSISIDGDDFVTNSNRVYGNGKPVYEDIKRAFSICREAGMDIGASCTLSESCIADFDGTMRVLLEECGVTNLGLNLLITSKEPFEGYNVKATEFIIKAFQIFRTRGIYEDRIMRKAIAFIERTVLPFDCGASGGNQIVISPNGDVGVCHGYAMGKKYFPTNVNDADFDIKTNPDFLEWSKRSPLNMPECQKCMALGICGGGCPFQAEITTGSIWGLDERFCVHAKMTLEWLIWDLYSQMKS
ncbi:MAG: radical SAM protein [Patescibacteria group bacterium]